MESIDSAYGELKIIIEEITKYGHTIITEQDTRLKVVDRILNEVLGYDLSEVMTEPYSGTGFIDYQMLIKGVGRLVIEAKKDGVDFSIDEFYSGRAFNLDGPLFKNKELKEGISQTI